MIEAQAVDASASHVIAANVAYYEFETLPLIPRGDLRGDPAPRFFSRVALVAPGQPGKNGVHGFTGRGHEAGHVFDPVPAQGHDAIGESITHDGTFGSKWACIQAPVR